MSFDYINEAFKKLDALNEDMFDTSLTGLNGLSDFMDQDDASDIVKVIDPEAETSDALSDSYIGKVIINCNVCHSHIFESKEDVVIDEDGVVNPEMQCPYCGEMSGFTVVGEIKPFEQEVKEDPETEDPAAEVVTTEDDVEEGLISNAVGSFVGTAAANAITEGFNFDTVMSDMETLKSFLRSKGHACKSKEAITYLWSVIDLFEAGDQEVNLENISKWYEETCRNFPEDLELLENVDEGLLGNAVGSFVGTAAANALSEDEDQDESLIGNAVGSFVGTAAANALTEDEVDESLVGSAVGAFTQKAVSNISEDAYTGDERMNSVPSKPVVPSGKNTKLKTAEEELTESIDDLSLTANGTHIEVDEDESGKVTLIAEPVESEDAGSVISPVSDETVSEITANNSDSSEEPEEETPVDESELDIELDEVDEEGLDELGESYLKNIYENVESFKTTAVSTNDTQMIVEGTITFNSGVKKNTGFVFEAYSASNDGTVKFVGKNSHFSSDARAFALTGKVSNNKLLPESLTYNYLAGSNKISGTVRKK